MLPTRHLPQNKRLTQTENEGLETNITSKWTWKKSQGSNTYINKNRLQKKTIKRDTETHLLILRGR